MPFLADISLNAIKNQGNDKQLDSLVRQLNEWGQQIRSSVTETLEVIYPIGSIYISVNSTMPEAIDSLGTWATFGAGKVLVGRDSGDTDFDVAGETGGAKTHTHDLSDSAWAQITTGTGAGNWPVIRRISVGTNWTDTHGNASNTSTTPGASRSTGVALDGATDAGSTMPPYIVVYMWKRTA